MANTMTVRAHDAIPYAEGSELLFPALSCQIAEVGLTCLVGPYRAQLRAYLLMLAGIYRPLAGEVDVLGQTISALNLLQWRKLRSQIGYLSGTASLQSTQHGLMNVMLPALYHAKRPFQETLDKAQALLRELNCEFEFTAFPAQLSSFQKSQLALARALILDPALLIMDVPFNDLGAKEREKMGRLLGKYPQHRAVCMIGGLQYIHFLEQHADQIIFISEHKIITFNGWRSFTQTEDPDVQDLLSVL
ncbi:MAG: ATP-binding cassette domain-containing protein [Methylococcales bacterium]|nr:ATP-binding cassette domain-containing protein [Methylococcaceae bacterium]